MKKHLSFRQVSVVFLLSVFISSCGLLRLNFKVFNPQRAGSYPKETKRILLLGAGSSYRNCFDVHHYELNIEVDPSKKFISGKVLIHSKATVDFDTLQLDLYRNMKILSIESNHRPLDYKRDEGAVFITMPARIRQSETFEITVFYEGNPGIAKRPPWRGGFVWETDEDGNPWIGVACESEGSSMWFPCKDMMNDEADSTDIRITVPKNLMAVSNGVLKDSVITTDKNMYHWHTSYPINNYNITMYVGNFKLLKDSFASTLSLSSTELNHYVLPYNYEKAKVHFRQVKLHMAFYEKMFGPYPWQRDGFKLVESPYAGMEHQSAIAYGNGYKNNYEDTFDYIILHETAHEWWGNSVTAADLSDAWIHEGFATYCEALYVESIKGHDAYTNYMGWEKIMIRNKRPVVHKRGIRYFDYRDGDMYTKGAWVLHTLRTVMHDDTLFFDILKTFRMENHGKQILTETFIELVNKKTGKDYNWFFKQYLYKREAPFLEFCWHSNNLYFKWQNTEEDFIMPVELEVRDKILVIYPTRSVQMIKLTNYETFKMNTADAYYGTEYNSELEWDFFEKKR